MSTLFISGNSFAARTLSILTVGSVNTEIIKFVPDATWSGLNKIAVFRNMAEDKEYQIQLDDTMTCAVPWECLSQKGTLEVGLLGLDGASIVKPTVWCTYGNVVDGVPTDGGIDTSEPTPSLVQQILDTAEQAKNIAQGVRDDADSGAFDGTSPEITVKEDTASSYILTIKDVNGEFDTPNLKGGTSGGGVGENGATFYPSVSTDGTLSWTNDKGLENPEPVNIKGEQGIQGPQGIQGEIGPQGPKGDTGPTGPQGLQGPVGPQGEAGPQGEQGPQGIQGPQGQDGYTPIKGTDYWTEADKQEIVQDVLSSLPVYNGEVE